MNLHPPRPEYEDTLRPWRLLVFIVVAAIAFCGAAHGQFADARIVWPSAVKTAAEPMPPDQLDFVVANRDTFHVFREFEGAADALKSLAPKIKGQPLKAGEIVEANVAGKELLGAPLDVSGGVAVYAAGIISLDARGVKLRLDVSGLLPGEEAWVVDPLHLVSFGPYTAGDDGEVWAATVFGDEAVLLVKTPYDGAPEIALTGYSHIFRSVSEVRTDLSCHLDVSCQDEDTVRAANAVAVLLIDARWLCSGSLINNPDVPPDVPDTEIRPFLLTANHCVCSHALTVNTEVIWDYRSTECNGLPPESRGGMPLRSSGKKLLATSAAFDATLIELDRAPAGPEGWRLYLGWNQNQLTVGTQVRGIHHPAGSHMRFAAGSVRAIDDDKNNRLRQTLVRWSHGVTEGGSSGSCLLLNNNQIVGMLSQGPVHSCSTTINNNIDWFASLHHFYPMIAAYINEYPASNARGNDDCGGNTDRCPLSMAYAGAPALLNGLRATRDRLLAPTAAGDHLIGIYYKTAPAVAPAVEGSPLARGAIFAATAPLARIGMLVSLLPE